MAPDKDRPSYQNGRGATAKWLYIAIVALAVSFVITNAFGVYVIIRSNQVNNALCNVTNDNRHILRQILIESRRQAVENALSVQRRNLIRQSFNELLALVPTVACNKSGGPIFTTPEP